MNALDGRCHCGALRFTVRVDLPFETSRCDCSICRPTRFWKTIVPADTFVLDAADEPGRYRFGTGTIEHVFCRRCGVRTHGLGTTEDDDPFVAINVACLAPATLATLPVSYQNGAHDAWADAPEFAAHL